MFSFYFPQHIFLKSVFFFCLCSTVLCSRYTFFFLTFRQRCWLHSGCISSLWFSFLFISLLFESSSLTLNCSVILLSITYVHSYWHFCQAAWCHTLPGLVEASLCSPFFPESSTSGLCESYSLRPCSSSFLCLNHCVSSVFLLPLVVVWPLILWGATALKCSFAHVEVCRARMVLPAPALAGVLTKSPLLPVHWFSSVSTPTLILGAVRHSTQNFFEWLIFCFLLGSSKAIINCFNVIYNVVLSNYLYLTCQPVLEYSFIPLLIISASNQSTIIMHYYCIF